MTKTSRTFLSVYVALLSLLAITIGSTFLELGVFNPIINLGVACAKAMLILWFFMHLRESSGLVRLFAAGGLFWLMLLLILNVGDWIARLA